MPNPRVSLEVIKYSGDTAVDGEACKVITHGWQFLECGAVGLVKTVLKQRGDTVFFRNAATNSTWQILYNFAANVGQSWNVLLVNNFNTPSTLNYSVSVLSISNTVVNSMSLKQMQVQIKRGNQSNIVTITERFGADVYLFCFYNSSKGFCDNDWFTRFLCYRDDEIGEIIFSNYGCNYNFQVGLDKRDNFSDIKIWPNPSTNKIHFTNAATCIELVDALGRQCINTATYATELDISELTPGLYHIKGNDVEGNNFSMKLQKQ